MGLGDISVHSYLDQPFHADIQLIDVGNTPLNEIKVTLASAEDFVRVGLERAFALNLLSFQVKKDKHGNPIVDISSTERISEPYMQMLVDLAWAGGQVYRSYNILLDPPNYKLVLAKKQLRTIVQRQSEAESSFSNEGATSHSEERQELASGAVAYGPIQPGETVWQVAQRYKTEDVLLQQLILAIVGSNQAAFKEGNLNGLVVGARLQIPNTQTASKVPAALAKSEVLAHDNAWQTRQPIIHTLLPPYINSTAPMADNTTDLSSLGYPIAFSQIPSISEPVKDDSMSSQVLPIFINSSKSPVAAAKNVASAVAENKAVIDVSTTAINSMREANAVLTEQLHALQTENKRLKTQSIEHKKAMEKLRHDMQLLNDKQQSLSDAHSGNAWFWILSLLWLGLGIKIIYPWLLIQIEKIKQSGNKGIVEEKTTEDVVKEDIPPPVITAPLVTEEIMVEQPEDATPDLMPADGKPEVFEPVLEMLPTPEPPIEPPELNIPDDIPAPPKEVDFEPVIEFVVPPEESIKLDDNIEIIPEPKQEPKLPAKEDISIEFDVSVPTVDTSSGNPPITEEAVQPAKSSSALETLLSLAKTYMTMDDVESAIESLQEVIEFGNDKQKEEATRLLNQLKKK